MASRDPLAGLRDKLYWRPGETTMRWHCLKAYKHGYISLCGRATSDRSGGQACCRPPAWMRCAQCDIAEIGRRGADESMPESADWKDAW